MAINMKSMLIAILLIIIAFIVIFNFVGTSSDDLTGAADTITDANKCTRTRDSANELMTFNTTSRFCVNSTGNDDVATGDGSTVMPLASLFSSSGVALLILMAAILIFVIILAMKSFKGKQ